MPGATTSPLDQLLGPSTCWAIYCRTCNKLPRRSFSLPFLPSQWPSRRRVSQHAASHSSTVPAPIGDCSEILAPGAHNDLTQPLSLGAPMATLTLWCVCVCLCVCVCVCNILLVVFYVTPTYLRSRLPLSSRPRLYTRYTPTPISPLLYAENRSPPLPSSLTSSRLVGPVLPPYI